MSSSYWGTLRVAALAVLMCGYVRVFAVTKTAVQTGNWATAATWSPSGVPANTDDIVIPNGITVSHSNPPKTIRNVQINTGGTLVSEGQLNINGTYINNGTHSGAGVVRLQATAPTIGGTGLIATSAQFQASAKLIILSGADITRTNGALRFANNDSLINLGTLRLGPGVTMGGNNNSTFYNAPTGILYIEQTPISSGRFVVNATGNTVVYNMNGNGTQTLHATFNGAGYSNLRIEGDNNSGQKVLTENTIVSGNLTVAGSTLTLSATYTISVGGNIIRSGGQINPGNSTITLNGSGAQSISLGDFTFPNNLVVANTGSGVSIANTDTIRVSGQMQITSGTLNTNGRLIVNSENGNDGSIGPIAATGSIVGNVRNLRYIAQGATNWRFLCSPTTNATFQHWKDDFITAGFPGSHFPNHFYTSIWAYDETAAGHSDSGFYKISINDTIVPGRAYWVYCGDSLQGTNAFTIDVTGPVNQGTFTFNPTFTANTELQYDGWNLMGNPYPSTIDWDSPNWTKTNIDNAIYLYNTNMNQYATYINGVGANGGNRYIPMGHGFYVHANAANPSLVVQETAKSSLTVPFLRQELMDELIVRLSVEQGSHSNESVVRVVPESSRGFDGDWDAYYFEGLGGNNTGLKSFIGTAGASIQALPIPDTDTIFFAVKADKGVAKMHYAVETIKGHFCLELLDTKANTVTELNSNEGELEFVHNNNNWQDRFALIINRTGTDDCSGSTGLSKPQPNAEQRIGYLDNRTFVVFPWDGVDRFPVLFYSAQGSLLMTASAGSERIDLSALPASVLVIRSGHRVQRAAVIE